MKVRELIVPNPVWTTPYITITEAARIMEDRDCAFVPILENGRVVGVVTDRDLAVKAATRGLNPGFTRVSEVMSQPAFVVDADKDPDDAARIMIERNVRRLVVVEDDRFLGVLSVVDLAGLVPDDRVAGTLHTLAEHNRPRVGHGGSEPIGGQFLG
ncbi:MAG: CBS domain-containing protein [Fimbriimonas sp.]